MWALLIAIFAILGSIGGLLGGVTRMREVWPVTV
jgi:hypothetical protein